MPALVFAQTMRLRELHYENALIVADGDYVMLHENGLLAEHWDVIQDEATRESSKSGLPMFGDKWYITAPRGEVMAARPSRGPGGARDEFLLAATAQSLRKLAKLRSMPMVFA